MYDTKISLYLFQNKTKVFISYVSIPDSHNRNKLLISEKFFQKTAYFTIFVKRYFKKDYIFTKFRNLTTTNNKFLET